MAFANYFAAVQATPGWQAVLESFCRFMAVPPGSRVLDVGCGPGSFARLLTEQGQQVTALDLDPVMVQLAVDASKAASKAASTSEHYLTANVLALPFAAHSFDAVLATNVVFLVPDPAQALREMTRVTRPAGQVGMLNPSENMSLAAATALADERSLTGIARESLLNWGRAAEANRRLTPAQIHSLFSQAGLQPPQLADKLGSGLARFAKSTPST